MKNEAGLFDNVKSTSGAPNPVDVHVGNRIRLRRTLLGYTQQFMARKLGLTFQQIQKYERGCNRVGASRLWDISKVLNVPMDFFFEEMGKDIENQSPMMQIMPDSETCLMLNEEVKQIDIDPMKRQETIELVRAYYRITNRALAKQLFDLIVSLSKTSSKLADE
ncbi:MAG: helix-turn-helix transcriptional regulator [Alphaproteobacteria bacterium]|nr:helix-turn-helix transcriptional regulator [Alphaproteobacteria bacterium]